MKVILSAIVLLFCITCDADDKIYVYLNPEFLNEDNFKLVKETCTGNLSRERFKIACDINRGEESEDNISNRLQEIENLYESLKDKIEIIETNTYFSPCYSLSKRNGDIAQIDLYYTLEGKKQIIQYPSQILKQFQLTLAIKNFFNNSLSTSYTSYSKNPYYSCRAFISINTERWQDIDKTTTIYMTYIQCREIGLNVPFDRVIQINEPYYDSRTSNKFCSNKKLYAVLLKSLKYINNNTIYKDSKKIKKEISTLEYLLKNENI